MMNIAEQAYIVKKEKIKKAEKIDYTNKKSNILLLIGINIFLFLCFLFLVPTILYFFDITINKIYFPISILFIAITSYIITGKSIKKSIIVLLITVLSIFSSIFVSSKIIDTSIDGNSYRKITSGMMIEGWNPLKESAREYNKNHKILPDKLSKFGNKSQWFWLDVYPKGLATFGATIEKSFSNIESGKCYTLLTMIILFFVYTHYISYFLNKKKSMLLSLLLALNPVSMCQLRTFYVDATLSNILLLAIAFLLLYFKENRKMKKIYVLLFSLCIIYIFNIKFNGILFIGILGLALWLIVLINDIKKRNYKESKFIFITFAISVIVSIIVGFSPYITNITRYNELLPGITGNSTKASGAVTDSTVKHSTFENFYIIIFSKVGDYWSDKEPPLKIPFTTTKEEIENYYIHASNFGTFGAFFGGIFIIAIIAGTYIIIRHRKELFKSKDGKYMLLMTLLIYLQSNFSPIGFGGLRYVAHFYVIIIFILGLVMYYNKKQSKKIIKNICNCGIAGFIILLVLNISPYFKIYASEIKLEEKSRPVLKKLAKNQNNLQIALSTASSHGLLLNLRQYGINYGNYEFITDEFRENEFKYTMSYQIKFKYKNDKR